jgi:chorismate dehydratase
MRTNVALDSPTSAHQAGRTLRVGSVSFLNAKPLIDGLDATPDVALSLAVPSALLGGMRRGELDVALLPVIDYQRMDGLRVVPSGGIGCDGETLTVRIFSRVRVGEIRTLACDTDSHTSVALARVIFAEQYGTRPTFVDWAREGGDEPCDARLLIGDKVVCEEPAGFEHQLDLGAAWRTLTGLPFVFAVWTTRAGVDLGDLPRELEGAKRRGLANIADIVKRYAVPRGWPAGLAMQYLSVYLKFDVGERELEAIRLFHRLAAKYGVIEGAPRELALYEDGRPRGGVRG